MRRKIVALFLIMFGSIYLYGQVYQLPNAGFENWDGNGSDDEPTYWNGFPSASCDLSFPASLGCGTATETRHAKSTDIRPESEGNYSIKIFATVINILGNDVTANGNITTGQIRIGSSTATDPQNYNISRTSNSSISQEFNAKPDSIVFWAKFECPSTSQNARMSATIHDSYDYRDPEGSDSNAPNHVVGKAIKNFTRGNQEWQRHSVAFDYSYPATVPEYILLTFTTNMIAGEGSNNDILFVDDVEFIYVTSLNEITVDGSLINGFNPATLTYTIDAECGSIPSVDANSTSNLANITITQTDGSGPATIEVTNGNESSTYTINFNFTHKTYIDDDICQGELYN